MGTGLAGGSDPAEVLSRIFAAEAGVDTDGGDDRRRRMELAELMGGEVQVDG